MANRVYPASLVDNAFVKWSNLCISKFKDLYVANTSASFQQDSGKFSIPTVYYFRFLQVHSFAHHTFPMSPKAPGEQCWDYSIKEVQLLITPLKGIIIIRNNYVLNYFVS